MALLLPYVPPEITVHLGAPDQPAQNITVPFTDYIKNVASSELYPTWPEEALRANILAQVSFTLNRIYTEFYRAQGYDFDITSSTAFDQAFVQNRDIFENISNLVDQLFNSYVRRDGFIEPLLAIYCDGVRTTCPGGLSQWGTVGLAEAGLVPFDILQTYYGNNIGIVYDAPIFFTPESYPGVAIRRGDFGDNVSAIQRRLNAISVNYPSIDKINPVDGIFGEQTERSVRQFQRIFNLTQDGIVGKATWYEIIQIFNAVRRLNEVNSQGLTAEGVPVAFYRSMSLGSSGLDVQFLQFLINTIATYSDVVPFVPQDGIFGTSTENAVKSFQRSAGLPETGVADEETFNTLYNTYVGYIASSVVNFGSPVPVSYPGTPLRLGDRNEYVRLMQRYLAAISQVYPQIPPFVAEGLFGTSTRDAVIAFQELFGLQPDGIVGPLTWNKIAEIYVEVRDSLARKEGQFPGYDLTAPQ